MPQAELARWIELGHIGRIPLYQVRIGLETISGVLDRDRGDVENGQVGTASRQEFVYQTGGTAANIDDPRGGIELARSDQFQ